MLSDHQLSLGYGRRSPVDKSRTGEGGKPALLIHECVTKKKIRSTSREVLLLQLTS